MTATVTFFSCSNDEVETTTESETLSPTGLSYSYLGELYDSHIFESNFENILLNSDQVYDLDKQVITVFSDAEEADLFINKTSDSTIPNLKVLPNAKKNFQTSSTEEEGMPCGDPLYSFRVSFFEDINFEGKKITFVRKHLNAFTTSNKGTFINLPKVWKKRASSLKAETLKLANFVVNGECQPSTPSLNLFNDTADSDSSSLLSLAILDLSTFETVLNLSNLGDDDFDDSIDNFNVSY